MANFFFPISFAALIKNFVTPFASIQCVCVCTENVNVIVVDGIERRSHYNGDIFYHELKRFPVFQRTRTEYCDVSPPPRVYSNESQNDVRTEFARGYDI